MKKVLVPLMFVVIVLGCESKKETTQSPETTSAPPTNKQGAPARASVQNDLPRFPVEMIDGTTQQISRMPRKTVVVLFQPECDHCQREATEMHENVSSFDDYHVYFISSAPLEEIQKFSVDYKLGDIPNYYFGTASAINIVEQYGSIPAPSLYVYSKEGKLIKDFKGETPIEEILGVL